MQKLTKAPPWYRGTILNKPLPLLSVKDTSQFGQTSMSGSLAWYLAILKRVFPFAFLITYAVSASPWVIKLMPDRTHINDMDTAEEHDDATGQRAEH